MRRSGSVNVLTDSVPILFLFGFLLIDWMTWMMDLILIYLDFYLSVFYAFLFLYWVLA